MARVQFDEDTALLHLQRFCRRRNDYLASLPPGTRRPATNASSASLYSFIPQSPSSSSLLRSQRNASVKIQRYARARLARLKIAGRPRPAKTSPTEEEHTAPTLSVWDAFRQKEAQRSLVRDDPVLPHDPRAAVRVRLLLSPAVPEVRELENNATARDALREELGAVLALDPSQVQLVAIERTVVELKVSPLLERASAALAVDLKLTPLLGTHAMPPAAAAAARARALPSRPAAAARARSSRRRG